MNQIIVPILAATKRVITLRDTKTVFFSVIASIICPVGFPARAYPQPIAIKAYKVLARTILLGVKGSSLFT